MTMNKKGKKDGKINRKTPPKSRRKTSRKLHNTIVNIYNQKNIQSTTGYGEVKSIDRYKGYNDLIIDLIKLGTMTKYSADNNNLNDTICFQVNGVHLYIFIKI
ncbi:unnamed protein product [Cunninghamella echinulata]